MPCPWIPVCGISNLWKLVNSTSTMTIIPTFSQISAKFGPNLSPIRIMMWFCITRIVLMTNYTLSQCPPGIIRISFAFVCPRIEFGTISSMMKLWKWMIAMRVLSTSCPSCWTITLYFSPEWIIWGFQLPFNCFSCL